MAKKVKKKAVVKTKKKATKKAVKKVVKKAAKKAAPRKAVKKKVNKKANKKTTPAPAAKQMGLSPYLNFAGSCEDAFGFYKSVFGGNYSMFARFNEMPPMEGQPPMPEEHGKKVMHVSLTISKGSILMGSDLLEGFGPPAVIGNNFAVSVNATSRAEADRLFNGLSDGGHVTMPIGDTFWGAYFGMFTDKFGINWQINFDKN